MRDTLNNRIGLVTLVAKRLTHYDAVRQPLYANARIVLKGLEDHLTQPVSCPNQTSQEFKTRLLRLSRFLRSESVGKHNDTVGHQAVRIKSIHICLHAR